MCSVCSHQPEFLHNIYIIDYIQHWHIIAKYVLDQIGWHKIDFSLKMYSLKFTSVIDFEAATLAKKRDVEHAVLPL